jgi:hypothetical protein
MWVDDVLPVAEGMVGSEQKESEGQKERKSVSPVGSQRSVDANLVSDVPCCSDSY